ncbi:trypsin-like peptidase domain-containing protein [Streptomyces sp. NPDC101151]|uniref:nSTAND1 domain-containing NTPase n=1 Tax=Streptomyces sp. NPDC101151 TaxID=3366115 RepID=UPI00381DC7D1
MAQRSLVTPPPPHHGVVRVLDREGATAGTGFLLTDDGLIATCAHVVHSAESGPGDVVELVFVVGGERMTATVDPDHWCGPDAEDVAVLRLEGTAPRTAVPLSLRRAAGGAGNRFMTYGFPDGLSEEGLWGYGTIGHLTTDRSGAPVLQLTATTETTRGFSGAPVIDQLSQRVVGMVTTITASDAYGRLTATAFATPSETLRRICPRLQVSQVCPYRSLDFFDTEHAPYYFGRERILRRVLERLRGQPRLLALLGPSGSGKTSLLRAGLIAGLAGGALPGSERWHLIVCRPSDLAADASLFDLRQSDDTHTLLALDQFEDLLIQDETAVERLGMQLVRLLASRVAVTVVLVMRDDFYSKLAGALPDLMSRWVVPHLINVPAVLDVEELSDIVRKPADRAGLVLEDGLLEAVLDEAVAVAPAGRPGAARSTVLPLLEFALTQLWHRQEDGVVPRAVFRAMGGVAGGIAQWADDVYGQLTLAIRPLARIILTLLVQPADDRLGVPEARRRRFLDEIDAQYGHFSARAVHDVLGHLVSGRLLVTSRDDATGRVTVELIHDVLLREWRQMRLWLDEDAEFLRWRQSLEYRLGPVPMAAAGPTAQLPDSGSAAAGPSWLDGRELDQARRWLVTRPGDLDARQRAYIEKSLAARERRRDQERELYARAERAAQEAEHQRQIAQTLDLVARLRGEAEDAVARLALEPARALASVIATTATSLEGLGGEPIAVVQAGLHAAVRASKERLVLPGSGHAVMSVAYGPGGAWLVGGDEGGSVRTWSMAGPPGEGRRLFGAGDAVLSVAVHSGSGLLAAGGRDGSVLLWRSSGVALQERLAGPLDAVLGLAFCPSGLLAAACADGGLYVWSAEGELLTRLEHNSWVASVVFSVDGQLIASGDGTGRLRLWRCSGFRLEAETETGQSFVTSVAMSPSQRSIAAACGRTVTLWRPEDGRQDRPSAGTVTEIAQHQSLVTAVAFSPDGTVLLSTDEGGTAQLREVSGAPAHAPLVTGGDPVTSVAFSPDGRAIAGACGGQIRVWDWLPPGAAMPTPSPIGGSDGDRSVRRWDGGGGQARPAWTGHKDIVTAVAFNHDGNRVVSAGADRTLLFRDLDGRELARATRAHDGGITALACSPQGFHVIATGGRDNTVRLWDLSGSPLAEPFTGHTADVMAIAFSPAADLVASSGRDRTVRLWRLDGAPHGRPWTGHSHSVVAVAFSPGGDLVATGSGDGTVRLWRPDGSPHAEPLVGHLGYVHAVAFSPDGRTVASGGADRTVRLWHLDGRPAARPWHGHHSAVRSLAFHPDGHMLLSAGDDATVRSWELRSGPLLRPWQAHTGSVLALAVSPDGEWAATAGEDRTVRLWRLGSWRSWLREGCDRLDWHPLLDEDTETARAVRRVRANAPWLNGMEGP